MSIKGISRHNIHRNTVQLTRGRLHKRTHQRHLPPRPHHHKPVNSRRRLYSLTNEAKHPRRHNLHLNGTQRQGQNVSVQRPITRRTTSSHRRHRIIKLQIRRHNNTHARYHSPLSNQHRRSSKSTFAHNYHSRPTRNSNDRIRKLTPSSRRIKTSTDRTNRNLNPQSYNRHIVTDHTRPRLRNSTTNNHTVGRGGLSHRPAPIHFRPKLYRRNTR